jgi:signal peptidase I
VNVLKAIRTTAIAAMAVVCFALAAVTMVPAALGMEHYVIVGGSMDGTIDRGSVVFDESVPVGALRVGDVITYTPPSNAHANPLVTHRIVSIQRGKDQARVFRTKGDANEAPDPWHFTLDQPDQAKVAGHVPYVGYALAALEIRWVRLLAIGVPALLVALSVFASLVRDAREERSIEARCGPRATRSER